MLGRIVVRHGPGFPRGRRRFERARVKGKGSKMKLFRHGPIGHERPGVVSPTGRPVDASAFGEDYDEVFFAERGLERLAAWLATYDCPEVPSDARIGAPIARPSKIVCIGLNYRAHARETNVP